jgi:hypothetical protein
MTRQTPHQLLIEGATHRITLMQGRGHFDPHEHGLQPFSNSSFSWGGYCCTYTLEQGALWLCELAINHHPPQGPLPELAGCPGRHRREGDSLFLHYYEGMRLPVPFTGELRARLWASAQASHPHAAPQQVLWFEAGRLLNVTPTTPPADGAPQQMQ